MDQMENKALGSMTTPAGCPGKVVSYRTAHSEAPSAKPAPLQ